MDIERKEWEILCSEQEIQMRLKELGDQISEDYKDKKLYVISLLKGSFIFTADLVRKLSIPVKVNFMTTSSYGDATESSGKVSILADIQEDLMGYDVLITDDIADSGLTMKKVMDHISAKSPNSVRCCVLLDKPERRKVELSPDYVGFTIPDKFVVGYGLNYGDYYRNIPYVFAVTGRDRKND